MKYLVCKFNRENKYFITTRTARESMINSLNEIGETVDSVVLKSFPDYNEAIKYKTEIEKADKTIDRLL